MASEIRVDKINSLSGVGTVTLSPTGVDIAGITTAETLKATTGIVTTLTATTGIVTTLTANTVTSLGAVSGTTGTFSAAVSGTTGTFSSSVSGTTGTYSDDVTVTGSNKKFITNSSSSGDYIRLYAAGGTGKWDIYGNGANLRFSDNDSAGSIVFDRDVIVGSAVTISESGIDASGVGVTCSNINGGQIAGRRNIIINGAMNVTQRGTSHTPSNSTSTYQIDRFIMENANDGAYTVSQSSTVPDNKFKHSLKVDVTTADTSLSSAQYCQFQQRVEGTNLTAVENFRQPMTFSFWVRSNKTGNYSFTLQQSDNSSRQMSGQYTISAANTWEKKIITVPADSSGTVNDDNGIGMTITWGLAYGSNYTSGSLSTNNAFKNYSVGDFGAGQGVNILDSTSNEWYLTGVQMEIGTQATPFEHRHVTDEVALCQRYFYRYRTYHTYGQFFSWISYGNTDQRTQNIFFPVPMRSSPSLSYNTDMSQYQNLGLGGNITQFQLADDGTNRDSTALRVTTADTITSGYGGRVRATSGTEGYFDFDAEL